MVRRILVRGEVKGALGAKYPLADHVSHTLIMVSMAMNEQKLTFRSVEAARAGQNHIFFGTLNSKGLA